MPVVIEESIFESREAEDAPVRRAEDRESVWASPSSLAPQGTIEEEEIEEEEADIAHYVEELEEDATFEELEEETRAAEEHREQIAQLVAAGEPIPAALSSDDGAGNGTEAEEDDSEELELEEAQAEAEALLAAESGSGEVSAELRAPAGTAGYTQRAQRSGTIIRSTAWTTWGQWRRWCTQIPASREYRRSADLRPAERRAGGPDTDCEGTDRQKGRAHHKSHCAPWTLSGLHADCESHWGFTEDFL